MMQFNLIQCRVKAENSNTSEQPFQSFLNTNKANKLNIEKKFKLWMVIMAYFCSESSYAI